MEQARKIHEYEKAFVLIAEFISEVPARSAAHAAAMLAACQMIAEEAIRKGKR